MQVMLPSLAPLLLLLRLLLLRLLLQMPLLLQEEPVVGAVAVAGMVPAHCLPTAQDQLQGSFLGETLALHRAGAGAWGGGGGVCEGARGWQGRRVRQGEACEPPKGLGTPQLEAVEEGQGGRGLRTLLRLATCPACGHSAYCPGMPTDLDPGHRCWPAAAWAH